MKYANVLFQKLALIYNAREGSIQFVTPINKQGNWRLKHLYEFMNGWISINDLISATIINGPQSCLR